MADSSTERIRSEETAVLIARLLLQRYTPYALIPAKTWFASVLDAVELFFRVRTSFLFFLGLSTFTAAYRLIVGVSEWYEWGTFIAALILGSLITRVTRMSFLGLSLETEQWTNAMLYQQQTQQAQAQGWNEGWQVGYAAASRLGRRPLAQPHLPHLSLPQTRTGKGLLDCRRAETISSPQFPRSSHGALVIGVQIWDAGNPPADRKRLP